jgi:hypothetical protein
LPPILPVLYNNMKKTVQTPEYVAILVEMNHDVRVVRMNQHHLPPTIRKWMGDSVGRWDGDTLVVDTTNFTSNPGLFMASEDLHVVERFKRLDQDTLLYEFTVEDPRTWVAPWSGQYPWPVREPRVRVRLPRGQLRARQHHARRAGAREGSPSRALKKAACHPRVGVKPGGGPAEA